MEATYIMKKSLTDPQKQRVHDLNSDGFTQAKIAQLFDVSQSTIHKILKENEIYNQGRIDERIEIAEKNNLKPFMHRISE
jgi:IS30 family transposase